MKKAQKHTHRIYLCKYDVCAITIRLFSAHSTNGVEKKSMVSKCFESINNQCNGPCRGAVRGQTKPNTVFITLCSNFHKPFFIVVVVGFSTVSSNHRVMYTLEMKSTEENGSSPPTLLWSNDQPTTHTI